MGALGNLDHERFCQALHKRVWAGEKRASARVAAYLETMYTGDQADMAAAAKSVAANARRLCQRKDVAGRLAELADYSAKLAGVDAGWGMVQAKRLVETRLSGFLTIPLVDGAPRFIDIARASDDDIDRLLEIAIEEDIVDAGEETMRRVRKTKIKRVDPISALALMARIGGWEAPKKIAPTDAAGTGPAQYVISERPLTDEEWERSRAIPA